MCFAFPGTSSADAPTQIAISFASADAEFGKQIGQMLEQLSYVDECDTLGQRANKEAIHKVCQ